MNQYKIIDEILFQIIGNEQKQLSALEIFEKQEDISKLGIRFSKISLDALIHLNFVDSSITLSLQAKKKDTLYNIPFYNNKFLNYVIINNTWHFVTIDCDELEYFIEKYNISLGNCLSFNQYLCLISDLKKNNFQFIDDVTDKMLSVKKYSPNKIIEEEIKGKLFKYQNIGFNWLSFMYVNNCGAILADEMGLGKTLQIISLMTYLRKIKEDSHFLVVCPLSLLENWKREIDKFCPHLKVLVHHGAHRTGSYYNLLPYNVIITSYSNIQNDLGMINMILWDLLVVDEAQNIKNPYATRTKIIKQIKTKCSIAVTGTPFENHIDDIWSIVDFVLPNYLGSLTSFKKEFVDDSTSAERIEPIITPLMLRRKVSEVAKDLPQRIDIPQPIIMQNEEAQIYEGNRKNALESLNELKIDKIQKLRMFCTHPLVYEPELHCSDPISVSSKYQRLCEIVEEVVSNNEKVLIFTSFNKMNELMLNDLKQRFGIKVFSITGSTAVENRQAIIDSFSSKDGSAVLVLNPKAAGAGLNITSANHVIHYNLEWNPAIEDQASARAFRRGQTKTVFVYRLFYVGTIEEIINDRIARKRNLFETAIVGNQGDINKEDLEKALNISPIGRTVNA